MYKLTDNPYMVLDQSTNTFIPKGHRLWDAYQKWCEDGNTPLPADAVAAPVPEVTMRQARLQLLSMGLLSEVDAAVAAMPGVQGEAARIEWEYAATVRRDNPTAQALMAMMGFTPAQVDAFFAGAAAL